LPWLLNDCWSHPVKQISNTIAWNTIACGALLALAACQQPGSDLAPNVYRVGQVNQMQNAKAVELLAVLPAKIEVSNQQSRAAAQLIGGLAGGLGGAVLGNNVAQHSAFNTLAGGALGGGAGALAGSLVPATTLVDGVSLTYEDHGKTLNSAQIGRLCEFKPGKAIVISPSEHETRVQPNTTCPDARA
jgi:outer membrane lipoprotein SlyB